MLVLRTIIDEEEDLSGRQAVHEAIQKRLSLGVDPMEILKDQTQRLHLTLAQDQMAQRLEGALPALRRVERAPLGVLDWDFQQGQQGRQRGPQRFVKGEHL